MQHCRRARSDAIHHLRYRCDLRRSLDLERCRQFLSLAIHGALRNEELQRAELAKYDIPSRISWFEEGLRNSLGQSNKLQRRAQRN